MYIQVALTEKIINECLALHFNHHPLGKRQQKKLIWIPLVLIIISVYLIYTELRQPVLGQNFYLALLYIAFAIGYYFFMKKRMLQSGKQLLKSLGSNAVFEMDVTEERLITTTQTSTTTHKWEVFTGALVSNDNVLLYNTNDSFSMFNKRFFSGSDFQQFQTWARQYVPLLIEA